MGGMSWDEMEVVAWGHDIDDDATQGTILLFAEEEACKEILLYINLLTREKLYVCILTTAKLFSSSFCYPEK